MATVQVGQDNIAIVRRGFEAFGAGDMATLAEVFHPEAAWRSKRIGVLGGDCIGRDAIFTMFGTIGSETKGDFKVTPTAIAASDNHVFVNATAAGSRNGKSIVSDEVLIFTLDNGQVSEVRLFLHDHPANAAFWE